jgi:hypothetical protein
MTNERIGTCSTISAVVKAIDRTIGKVRVTSSGRAADSTPQRGSLDCARYSIRLMSRSQVSLDVLRKAVVIDVWCVVIVFVALGVSAHPPPGIVADNI